MASLDIIQTLIDYDVAMTRQVWEAIQQIDDEQFLQEDGYSRGSIRNLMIHLTSTQRRWLAGLKAKEDVGHLDFKAYPGKAEGQALFEQVAAELKEYVAGLSEAELDQKPANVPASRADVLVHLVNHGTDHRSTVLQRLYALGAPTFEQDYITWLWTRERGE